MLHCGNGLHVLLYTCNGLDVLLYTCNGLDVLLDSGHRNDVGQVLLHGADSVVAQQIRSHRVDVGDVVAHRVDVGDVPRHGANGIDAVDVGRDVCHVLQTAGHRVDDSDVGTHGIHVGDASGHGAHVIRPLKVSGNGTDVVDVVGYGDDVAAGRRRVAYRRLRDSPEVIHYPGFPRAADVAGHGHHCADVTGRGRYVANVVGYRQQVRQLGVHGGDHEQLLFQLRDDICNGLTAGYRGFERTVHQLGQLLDLDNAAVQCVLNNARVKAALVGNGRRLLVTQVADSRQLLVRCQDSTAAQRVGDIAARVVLLVRVHLDGIIHALHKRGLDKLVRRLVQ